MDIEKYLDSTAKHWDKVGSSLDHDYYINDKKGLQAKLSTLREHREEALAVLRARRLNYITCELLGHLGTEQDIPALIVAHAHTSIGGGEKSGASENLYYATQSAIEKIMGNSKESPPITLLSEIISC